jgi:phosphatidylglycerol lysyltransferase
MESVRSVLAHARNPPANLALLGDKRFLWSGDRQAFIMYQVSGNSWVAMGDPVGPAGHYEELTWAFRELVDRHDGRTVFYQVSDEFLSLYVDLGLTLSKLGEDATTSLQDFSLQGSHRAELRQADNKAKKYGAVFQVIPRTDVTAIMDDLRRVSNSWLADKSSAEKGFSLGSFSESYIANFDCAIVKVDDVIVAFANLWPAPASGELSIDLMRYDRAAPKGVMDYLFVELMLWGSANGYLSFNLGMAPLSGLEQRSLAPFWYKIGHLIFTHGDNFYNFEGLRNYKNKFDPKWQPRYLACPGGWWHLPQSLVDVSRLISGGITKMVGR